VARRQHRRDHQTSDVTRMLAGREVMGSAIRFGLHPRPSPALIDENRIAFLGMCLKRFPLICASHQNQLLLGLHLQDVMLIGIGRTVEQSLACADGGRALRCDVLRQSHCRVMGIVRKPRYQA